MFKSKVIALSCIVAVVSSCNVFAAEQKPEDDYKGFSKTC